MKNLILVRHGKSSWDYPVNDKDRPLLLRGIKDGHLVVNEFRQNKIDIDAVYSSPANRALHTCLIFLRGMNYPYENFTISESLYDFSGDSVLSFIKSLKNELDTVLVFGHNHAFTHLANTLGSIYVENVTTSGLVHLRFDVDDWKNIQRGKTQNIIFPKHLK